ncbi:MAG: UDP-N-acetylmuramoyl-tripeptide--D-alanyl-D-alanine ligase [Pseudomonadota bacterium]
MQMPLSDIATLLNVPVSEQDPVILAASIDSRRVVPHDLFVALDGANTRGVEYIADAARNGAVAALAPEPVTADVPVLCVKDPLQALQTVANHWRQQVDATVIAITGSNGKTTMRSLVHACIGSRALATEGNYNNHIGVPMMLTRLMPDHARAVFELGANHAGEIAQMAGWVRPDIGIVTNAGPAHLEGFGSVEGVAHAKGELFAALDAKGIAIINADDDYAPLWHELAAPASILSFGSGPHADFWFEDCRGDNAGQQFLLHTPDGSVSVTLALSGRHNAMNAAGAVAVAVAAGIAVDDAVARLATVQAEPGRQRVLSARNGWRVIDDSYNANPGSMRAAAESLGTTKAPRWMVIGDMGELGANSDQMHFDTGVAIRAAGIDRLFTLGEHAAHAACGFGEDAERFVELDALLTALRTSSAQDVTVLVKGSRSARMERVVAALCDGEGV